MSEPETLIVDCPRCGTRFRLRTEALGRHGRHLRCSRCGHRWFMTPPGSGGEEVPPLPEGLAAGDVAAEDLETLRPRRLAALGWLAVALLVLVAVGLVVGRNEIAALWPRTVPLYARLGLPVELPLGLELRDVEVERREEGGVPVLVVRGDVHNVSGAERLVPPVRVALLDADGRELDFGLFPAGARVLPPGGVARFEARLLDPPPTAVRYTVTFAREVDAVP